MRLLVRRCMRLIRRGLRWWVGLADSAKLNVDVQSAERYVAALTPGTVDAVGYHDWVFDVSTPSMTTDQFTALRSRIRRRCVRGCRPTDIRACRSA